MRFYATFTSDTRRARIPEGTLVRPLFECVWAEFGVGFCVAVAVQTTASGPTTASAWRRRTTLSLAFLEGVFGWFTVAAGSWLWDSLLAALRAGWNSLTG